MARVLVVEDDPTVRELVSARLRSAGHRVQTAETGGAALELVRERGAPEVAVLDVGLPDLDGYTLLERLREIAGGSAFGAVFLSAGVTEDKIARGTALGATYLTKPFIASALIKAVDKATTDAVAEAGW